MYTEDEAKKKVCCNDNTDGGVNCSASECMAWRWGKMPIREYTIHCKVSEIGKHEWYRSEDLSRVICNKCGLDKYKDDLDNRQGFCGLAGKP